MSSDLPEFEYGVAAPPAQLDPITVREQMERIVLSSHFRQSRRYPVLLRYVVEQTLDGHAAELKERTLGIEVFQRTADYDTNADPIVRVAAGEVRKRIAQYYHDEGHADELRIDLPAGSYVPQFRSNQDRRVDPQMGPPSEAKKDLDIKTATPPSPAIADVMLPPKAVPLRQVQWKLLFTLPLLAALLLAAGWGLLREKPPALDAVWSPMFASKTPLLISSGIPELLREATNESDLTVRDHVYRRDLMTFSDVTALTALASLAKVRHHAYKLQIASATTFADLRGGPTILLGGYDNPWTMRQVEALRYRFRRNGKVCCWIEDTRNPGSHKWEVNFDDSYAKLGVDYAIVARFTDESSHQPIMIVAGIGENGTKAAAEFVTDPAIFQSLLGKQALSVAKSNFEVLLQATVIHGVSGPPRLVTTEVW